MIGEFVDWCHEGLRAAGRTGQILIVDSSTDGSPEIARGRRREVLQVPRRGLGRAYIDALPYISRQLRHHGRLRPHLRLPRASGRSSTSSTKATTSSWGAGLPARSSPARCPALHRYFGTPLTTWILNLIYGSPILRHPLRDARP